MEQKERMEKGLIYDPGAPELTGEQHVYMEKLWEFNQLRPSQRDKKQEYMKQTFAECGDDCYIELPFYANWGGKNLHFGNKVYANFNLTVVDDGEVFVGDYVNWKMKAAPVILLCTMYFPGWSWFIMTCTWNTAIKTRNRRQM